jgi:hypothetical protein
MSEKEKAKSKEVFDDFVGGTKKFFSRIKGDVDELSTKGKLRLDIVSLKNKRSRAFKELGMKAYLLVKHDRLSIPEAKGLLGELKDLEKEIDEKEEKIKEMIEEAEEESAEAKEEPKKKTAKTKAKPAAKKTARKTTVKKKAAAKPAEEETKEEI